MLSGSVLQAAKDAYVSFATRESVQPRGFAAAMNSVQQPQYNPFVQNVGHTQPVIPVDATPWTKVWKGHAYGRVSAGHE